jgi:hypothetical protein
LSSSRAKPERFAFDLGRKSRPLLLFWGVRESNAYIDLSGDRLDAHFGFFRLGTPLTNVARWQIEGPWLWIKALGVRRGFRDGDISFAGVHGAGIRLDFKEPVDWGPLHVPRLYLTPANLEGFAAALSARGIAGADVREPGA